MCITIIGIPVGIVAFKIGILAFCPFGKEIYVDANNANCCLNFLWILLCGWVTSLSFAILGCVWCITIIGIPFGLQCFKIAKIALLPAGAIICTTEEYQRLTNPHTFQTTNTTNVVYVPMPDGTTPIVPA